jgi:hypothetical protein
MADQNSKARTFQKNAFALLAAAHPEQSHRLYTSSLTAPTEYLEAAITDLDNFLHLFPNHTQAQQTKQQLQAALKPISK